MHPQRDPDLRLAKKIWLTCLMDSMGKPAGPAVPWGAWGVSGLSSFFYIQRKVVKQLYHSRVAGAVQRHAQLTRGLLG